MAGPSALIELGRQLASSGYRFTAITPASHARVLARREDARAADLRDVFGWNLPFDPRGEIVPGPLVDRLGSAGLLERSALGVRSRVRAATIDDRIYLHSAYPTDEDDAVFFGPDTYRFLRFLGDVLRSHDRLVDVGCGSGVGGLEQLRAGRAERVVLTDINARALEMAEANAALGGSVAELSHGSLFEPVTGIVDAVIANPPFLVDALARAYRHGGGSRGLDLSVQIVREALSRLRAGGTLALYSASPILGGRDLLLASLTPLLEARALSWQYAEIDPDIFGEELEGAAYRDVDRIAAVGLVALARGHA